MVDYDLATAQQMFKAGRYVYVIFMCHLAVEKSLKAVIFAKTKKLPPKTHDLIYLINLGDIKLASDLLDFVGIINNAGVMTRYPEDLSNLIANYPKEIVKEYLTKTTKVIKCIKQDVKLKK